MDEWITYHVSILSDDWSCGCVYLSGMYLRVCDTSSNKTMNSRITCVSRFSASIPCSTKPHICCSLPRGTASRRVTVAAQSLIAVAACHVASLLGRTRCSPNTHSRCSVPCVAMQTSCPQKFFPMVYESLCIRCAWCIIKKVWWGSSLGIPPP